MITTRIDFGQCNFRRLLYNLIEMDLREQKMSAATGIRDFLNKLASTLASPQRPADFVCADCERWARCGMPSSDNCIYRAEEIARGDWRVRRRVKALSLAMGWPTLLIWR